MNTCKTTSGNRCLVLNDSWFPIGIESFFKRSIRKLVNGRAVIIAETEYDGALYYESFTFEEWILREPTPGRPVIHTQKLCFELPEIIRKPYNKLHVQKLPMRASNVFARDGWKCWYCESTKELTLDHIKPKVKGGPTNWKNLISCCKKCNNTKGDMDPEDFCRIVGVAVPKPVNASSFPWLRDLGKTFPASWKKWLPFCKSQEDRSLPV